MEWSLSLLLFMRHPLVVAEDSCHFHLMGEETRVVKPNHCSKVYTANLPITFWSANFLCFSWQSPARKWSPIQNREAKPKPRQTQLVSRVLTQAIRFLIPRFPLFMECAITEVLQRWPKRDQLEKGWDGHLEKVDYWSPWSTILSLVLTFHLCTPISLLSNLSHLDITCSLKRCLAEMYKENGVHCIALYASPLKMLEIPGEMLLYCDLVFLNLECYPWVKHQSG